MPDCWYYVTKENIYVNAYCMSNKITFKRDSTCNSSKAQLNKNYIEPEVFEEHQRKVGGKDGKRLLS